jgi:methyl-accepting chemotaxis protein
MQNETTQPPANMTGEQVSSGNDAIKSGKEDLKAALANLASALNKFGAVAEVKAREEWKQAKPEIQRALDEMKRAVGVGAQKATTTIDSLNKKMDKSKTGEADAPTWTEEGSSTNPSDMNAPGSNDATQPPVV